MVVPVECVGPRLDGAARMSERVLVWLAWRLPRRLAYWAAIRVGVHATRGRWSHQVVPELYLVDALKRWGE